jgi:hypothetical protein
MRRALGVKGNDRAPSSSAASGCSGACGAGLAVSAGGSSPRALSGGLGRLAWASIPIAFRPASVMRKAERSPLSVVRQAGWSSSAAISSQSPALSKDSTTARRAAAGRRSGARATRSSRSAAAVRIARAVIPS